MDKLNIIETFDAKTEATTGYLERFRKWVSDLYYRLAKRVNWLLQWFGEDGSLEDIPYIQFDIDYEDGCFEGRLQWNSEDGTLEVGMPGSNVCLQIGQELIVRVKNTSGSTIGNGKVVYISGATGSRPTIALADADDYEKSIKTVAVTTEEILNNEFGYVTLIGLVRDIDTSAFSDGDIVYLSTTAGELTDTVPDVPAQPVRVGIVLRSHATEGVLGVKVDFFGFYPEIVYKDINLGGVSLTLKAVNRPDLITIDTTDILTYGFDGGVSEEEAHGAFELQHDYAEGEDFYPHAHIYTTSSGTGNIKFFLDYWIIDGDQNVVSGTLSDVVAATGTAWEQVFFDFGTISGTGHSIGDQMHIKIYRDPSDAQDTYADDAALGTVGIHYPVNNLGSRQVASK